LHVEERGQRGLAMVAGAQRGVAHRSQLAVLGFSRGAVARRVRGGSLFPVFNAVFAVGHPHLGPLALETAALLQAGPDCVLSHRSAALLWDLTSTSGRRGSVDVTVAGRRVHSRAGLAVRQVALLDARDVRLRRGLPVTAPARTLIDIAAVSSGDAELDRHLAQARMMELVTDDDLEAAMDRCPGRTGVGRLRALLRAERGPAVTRSEAERRLRALLDAARLPPPLYNAELHGFLVDALWAPQRLVVEVDGYRVHGQRAAFEADRARDQKLAANGYAVLRVTWRQLESEPMAVLARLAQALALAQRRAPSP
jgi:very-short-patch-repair endonuclease